MNPPNIRHKPLLCDCGCGRYGHTSDMRDVEVGYALDETLQRTGVLRRYQVLAECERPFTGELQAMKTLADLTTRYAMTRSDGTRASLWLRLRQARNVLKLQHAIYARPEQIKYGPEAGIARTKRRAVRSTLLFVAGMRMSRWLDVFWRWKDAKLKRADEIPLAPPEPVAGDADAITRMRAELVIEHGSEHPDNVVNLFDRHRK